MTGQEPEIIQSDLSEKYTQDGLSVQIDIYQEGEGKWLLEIIDQYNNSTVWDDPFPTDVAALNEAHVALHKEGIGSFIGEKSFTVV